MPKRALDSERKSVIKDMSAVVPPSTVIGALADGVIVNVFWLLVVAATPIVADAALSVPTTTTFALLSNTLSVCKWLAPPAKVMTPLPLRK